MKCELCGQEYTGDRCPECGMLNQSGADARLGVDWQTPTAGERKTKLHHHPEVERQAEGKPELNGDNPTVLYRHRPGEKGTSDEYNPKVALVLCLLLGWLGIHRFYQKKIGTGILYALTFGLFGVGWIVDSARMIGQMLQDRK